MAAPHTPWIACLLLPLDISHQRAPPTQLPTTPSPLKPPPPIPPHPWAPPACPAVGPLPVRTGNEILKAMRWLRPRWPQFALPLYVHHGEADK